jgi:transcriptional regulator with XRE-family HTH domain
MGLSYIGFYLYTMRSLHSALYKIFLKRLYKARENSGLTQIEVAKLLGKPQSFVSKCEQGERTVDVIDLLKFSKIYNVSLDYFFEGISIDDEPIQPIPS